MKKKYKIAIDAMGGDFGLKITVPSTINALNKNKNLYIYLVGDSLKIKKIIKENKNYDKKRLTIIHSDEIISMKESPIKAFKRKKKSSMRIAIEMVKKKTVDACVSSGNTGALMAISKFILKTPKKIERPAIIHEIPSINYKTKKMSSVHILDLGANINCSSKQLLQFGIMGSIMVQNIKKINKPKIALLNIGTEKIKGLDIIQNASKMFYKSKLINYVGYIESDNIFSSKADVVVCDGFTGNVLLKTIEGTAKTIKNIAKYNFKKNFFSKISMLICFPILNKLKSILNLNKYNGASLLGINGIVIKSHGSASIDSFDSAINQAIKEINIDIINKIKNSDI